MRRGAIILCGGKSVRMGTDKATLPFGQESMLQRVVRLTGQVAELRCMVVVAAAGQSLPELPKGVRVARDDQPDRGPLQGMAAGLRALDDQVEAVSVSGCDTPLLVPEFLQRLFELLEGVERFDVVAPRDEQFRYPLAAVYRTSVIGHVDRLLADEQLRLVSLLDQLKTYEVKLDELRCVDPQLQTVKNVNSLKSYHAALKSIDPNSPQVVP